MCYNQLCTFILQLRVTFSLSLCALINYIYLLATKNVPNVYLVICVIGLAVVLKFRNIDLLESATSKHLVPHVTQQCRHVTVQRRLVIISSRIRIITISITDSFEASLISSSFVRRVGVACVTTQSFTLSLQHQHHHRRMNRMDRTTVGHKQLWMMRG